MQTFSKELDKISHKLGCCADVTAITAVRADSSDFAYCKAAGFILYWASIARIGLPNTQENKGSFVFLLQFGKQNC